MKVVKQYCVTVKNNTIELQQPKDEYYEVSEIEDGTLILRPFMIDKKTNEKYSPDTLRSIYQGIKYIKDSVPIKLDFF